MTLGKLLQHRGRPYMMDRNHPAFKINRALEENSKSAEQALANTRIEPAVDESRLFSELCTDGFLSGDFDFVEKLTQQWIGRSGQNRLANSFKHLTGLYQNDGTVEDISSVKNHAEKFENFPSSHFIYAKYLEKNNEIVAAKREWELAYEGQRNNKRFYENIIDWPRLHIKGSSELEKSVSEIKNAFGWDNSKEIDPFIFFHIPFTGGSSISEALSILYNPKKSIKLSQRPGVHNSIFNLSWGDFENKTYEFVHLHAPYPIHNIMIGSNHRYFTLIRDPIEQLISGYFKNKNRYSGMGPPVNESFGGFIDDLADKNWKNRVCVGMVTLNADIDYINKQIYTGDNLLTLENEFSHLSLSEVYEIALKYLLTLADGFSNLSHNEIYETALKSITETGIFVGISELSDESYFYAMIAAGRTSIPYPRRIGGSNRPTDFEIDSNSMKKARKLFEADLDLYSDMKARFLVKSQEFKPLFDEFIRLKTS